MAYGDGLENRRCRKATAGSNPAPSAKTAFQNCLIGWQMWLHGLISLDIAAMEADKPPKSAIKLKYGQDKE